MEALDFLSFEPDFDAPATLKAYDELPLWSAMFGLLLLEEVPLSNIRNALDVGCGTGFPLIELAERLGPRSQAHGIDLSSGALARAAEKISVRRTPNVTLHEGSAATLPFPGETFDLIVSNLGVNNFDDRVAVLRECRRVARPGAVLALTTNVQGHMKEFYAIFEEILDDAGRRRLREHVEHRVSVTIIRDLLEHAGFKVTRVVEREGVMRFANGEALLNHYFIKLGFLDAWKKVVPGNEKRIFAELIRRLDRELRLTIPMAYVEAVASFTPTS
jgi:arsenite methyltransferase